MANFTWGRDRSDKLVLGPWAGLLQPPQFSFDNRPVLPSSPALLKRLPTYIVQEPSFF